jgi:glycosyltransferase involved in cell wall biosynthesis
MKRVIIYRDLLLELSETFIRQQALSLQSWIPTFVGRRLVPGGLDTAGLDSLLLRERRRAWLVSKKLQRWAQRRSEAAQMSAIGADLIHVHFGTDAVDNWPALGRTCLPTLVTLHGYDINIAKEWWESGAAGAHRRHYPSHLARLARSPLVDFIAVSKAIRETAISRGLPGEKIDVQYIGIDTGKFRPGDIPLAQRPKRILFLGRLVEKKGAAHLIRAFARVRAHDSEAELVIAGEGPLRGQLQALADSLRVPVDFVGAVTQDQALSLMHTSRVFALPSITASNGDAEGLPIVALEACATGLGVVTSARGAIDEVVQHEGTGLCHAEGDELALGIHLSKLLEDTDFLATLAGNARSFVEEHFNLGRCSASLERRYAEHAGSLASPPRRTRR